MNTLLKVLSSVYCMIAATVSFSQITFHKTYGGPGGDFCYSMDVIADGYILTGRTNSFSGDRAYLMKIDTLGGIEWAKIYGIEDEGSVSVCTTVDSGFVFAGFTDSTGSGLADVYVVKTDSVGDTLWTRRYGGVVEDNGVSILQTFDKGYVVAGSTRSYGQGEDDVYLVRIDSSGNLQWTRTIGGVSWDYSRAVQQTNDSNYVIVGTTYSFGSGNGDIYFVKISDTGNILWVKTYGSTDNEEGYSVQITNDNGFIITGSTNLTPEISPLLIKIDSNGNIEWSKRYLTGENTTGTSVIETTDGGYLLTGGTGFFLPGDVTYLIKTDSNGDTLWTKRYPRATPGNILQTDDGGYIVVRYVIQAFTGQESVISVLKMDSIGNIAGCNFYPTNITVSNLNLVVGTGGITGTGGVMNNTATTIGNAPFVVKDTCFVLGFVEPNSNNLIDIVITVYPNPTNGEFTISGNYGLPAVLEIYDLTGRQVYQQPVTSNQQPVNVSELPAGLYIWRIGNARGKVVVDN